MKKKTTEIAKNISSGAEKVEMIEKELKTSPSGETQKTSSVKKEQSAKGAAALGSERKQTVKKTVKTSVKNKELVGKAEAESKKAKERVEQAIKRKEEQEKRKALRAENAKKRAEERAKRIAALKANMKKYAEEREKLMQERARKMAEKKQEAAKKKAEHNRNRQEKREKRDSGRRSYGGWLAAVIALGAVTLALATTVTVGAIEMRKSARALLSSHRGTMYELTGIIENVDDDLDRVRVSASPAQQSRILTDLLVQARLAEMDLEKMPTEAEAERNITAFVNRTARFCERALGKLRNGERLTEQDYEAMEKLYQTCRGVREELERFTQSVTDKDLQSYLKKGEGILAETMDKLENLTLEENRMTFGMEEFGEKPTPHNGQERKIQPADAEARCKEYFKEYKIEKFECIGETVAKGYTAYNVQGFDQNGLQLFAEIDSVNGDLIRFDYYEECADETFDLENAERIAQQYLNGMGYENMTVAKFRENGTTTDFTFVYEMDGVAYYPDEVRVKVCRTRGLVSGMDASKYLKNHRPRVEPSVNISLEQAYQNLRKGLEVESSRLAVIKTARGETSAYEFLCSYGEEKYFIYVDAQGGEELAIVNARAIQ